jgi:hypothetical protein
VSILERKYFHIYSLLQSYIILYSSFSLIFLGEFYLLLFNIDGEHLILHEAHP